MKRVALDLEAYFRNVTGIHTYIEWLVPHLLRQSGGVEWTMFACADYAGRLHAGPFGLTDRLNYGVLSQRHRLNRLAFFAYGGKSVERDIGRHDVYHSPATPGFATKGAYVVTVHDLAWMRYGHIYPRRSIWARRIGLLRDLRRARRVLCVSAATEKDVVELGGCDPEKVRVAHSGVSSVFSSVRDMDGVERTLGRLGVRRPYLLTLAGDHSPRKNLDRLVRATALVRKRLGNLQLVVSGTPRFDTSAYQRAIDETGLGDSVVRPGFLCESELVDLIAGARVMAFPSLYEGFGFPIVEAMACGTPVVTSNVSSMPEVAGEAAMLVDPVDVEAIAGGIVRLVEDDALHDRMRLKGLERARCFTWERTAERVLEVYREAAG